MTDPAEPAHADAPQEPARDEPAPGVSQELIDERAKRIAAEVRADVNRRSAEAAEAGTRQAVAERDALIRRNEELAREAGRQDSIVEAINRVGTSIDNKFDATVSAIGGMRDEVKRLNDRPIIAPLASKLADQPTQSPLSKEEKEKKMVRTLSIIAIILGILFLGSAALAAIVITHPPGTGNTTVTAPPVHHCTWLEKDTATGCVPIIVTPPPAPPIVVTPPPATPIVPLAPALTVSSVAGLADSAENRLTEINEMCPSMESELRDTMANDFSFDYYKYYLPQSCGGYQSVLVEPEAVQPPSLTADELAQLNQLLAKQDAEAGTN